MRKRIILFFLSILAITQLLSQSKETELYNKVRLLYKTKCIPCIEKSSDCSIYYNKAEKAIDISNWIIPLKDCKISYKKHSLSYSNYEHYVEFACETGKCIYNAQRGEEITKFWNPICK